MNSFYPLLRRTVDPFGLMEATLRAQQAWLSHPEAFAERLSTYYHQLGEVNLQVAGRICGVKLTDAVSPVPYDERFRSPVWEENPLFDLLKEHYLLTTRWIEDALFETPDLDEKSRHKAAFFMRQVLNALSPTNFFWTNPEVMWETAATGGQNLLEGYRLWLEDLRRGTVSMVDEDDFRLGENLAATPGKVVFRNELLELIQYAPRREKVHAVPVVIIAPWINKYYILDLDAHKSLVRYLVSRGFTVFITSWKNPDASMRDTTFGDYLFKGGWKALEVAREICGSSTVHAVGYCIGGTLLATLMAWMNRGPEAERSIASWTLFTSLVDFSHPGEIEVFIDEESIRWLERQMEQKGYLEGENMAWSFRMLRSNSLLWRYVVHNYLFGQEPPPLDVLYWNTDTTRLPAAMHSEYLRRFYLENRLVRPDSLEYGGRPIDLGRIIQPLYAVGTEQDHIAPWKETFKVCSLVKGPVRYTLATSGHIMGIVNPPVEPPKRRYWSGPATGRRDPEAWRDEIVKLPGSWWEDWAEWLSGHCGRLVTPPALGSERYPPLEDAPGCYVRER